MKSIEKDTSGGEVMNTKPILNSALLLLTDNKGMNWEYFDWDGWLKSMLKLALALMIFHYFLSLWIVRKYAQGWYELTPEERKKNWWKFFQWSDKDIKKILKKRYRLVRKN